MGRTGFEPVTYKLERELIACVYSPNQISSFVERIRDLFTLTVQIPRSVFP